MHQYHIIGIRQDGSEVNLDGVDTGYANRGWCYASATKFAIDARVAGNPDNLVRLEVRGCDGGVLHEYRNSKDLVV